MVNTAAIVPPAELRRTILRVFTTKHSLQLHSSAISFITSTLAEHGLLDQPLEWEEAIDALAQGVVEGQSDVDGPSSHRGTSNDEEDASGASDVVTAAALEKVYSRLVVADSAAHTTTQFTSTGPSHHHYELTEGELPNPHRYFGVHSAFSQPKLLFDPIRKVFEPSPIPPTILPTAATRSSFPRQRFHILKSVILRNENFCPPLSIPSTTTGKSKNDEGGFMKLTSTKNLLGRQGSRFLLFGMLSTSSDGRYELEDADGSVGLDLQNAIPGEGIFTEGSLILVEGEYTVDERIKVFAIGHPPSETRSQARSIHAHTDFLGPPQEAVVKPKNRRDTGAEQWRGAISVKEEVNLKVHEENHADLCFVVFSDLHLDHQKSLGAFSTVLQGYVDADFIPFALVLCGNFASQQYSAADMVDKYKAGFSALAETLATFPAIVRTSQIILVPGPSDPFSTSLVPRPPLPQLLVQPLLTKLAPLQATIHLASNPCRISYFSQQIVIYRDDTMTRFLRNTVRIKDEAQEQEREEREKEERDLKKFLVSTVLDQAHLVPLAQRIRPVLWDHDHSLSLYPMPTALVLADAYDRYELTYEGCHVVNPGSFRSGNSFAWSTYYPATRRTEPSELPMS